MQQTNQYVPCPQCGSTDVKKVTYTWWGGALGPFLFKLVKCNACGTEYNGKTGQSNRNNIIIYIVSSFVIAFCACGGLFVMLAVLNQN